MPKTLGSRWIFIFTTLLLGWGLRYTLFPTGNDALAEIVSPDQPAIATWSNGRYQLCSEPDPQTWKDGAGVCILFDKTGQHIEGYYGYPHSDRFICLRGSIAGNDFQGEALALTWFPSAQPKLATLEKQWDAEGRMLVDRPRIQDLEAVEEGWVAWVHFQAAHLELQGLHRYTKAKMRPGKDLCQWP